jgi:hypothetical protein
LVRKVICSVQVADVAGSPAGSVAAGSIHCTVDPAVI